MALVPDQDGRLHVNIGNAGEHPANSPAAQILGVTHLGAGLTVLRVKRTATDALGVLGVEELVRICADLRVNPTTQDGFGLLARGAAKGDGDVVTTVLVRGANDIRSPVAHALRGVVECVVDKDGNMLVLGVDGGLTRTTVKRVSANLANSEPFMIPSGPLHKDDAHIRPEWTRALESVRLARPTQVFVEGEPRHVWSVVWRIEVGVIVLFLDAVTLEEIGLQQVPGVLYATPVIGRPRMMTVSAVKKDDECSLMRGVVAFPFARRPRPLRHIPEPSERFRRTLADLRAQSTK